MKPLTKTTAIFDRTVNLFAVSAAVVIAFLTLSVSLEVVLRSILGHSVMWWLIEIAEYCLLFIPFMAGAWLLKKDWHVKMDIVLEQLEPKTQAIINMITSFLGAIMCLVITWYGAKVTWQHFQLGYVVPTELRPPTFAIMLIIPLGMFPFFIQFLRSSYGYLRSWRELSDQEQNP